MKKRDMENSLVRNLFLDKVIMDFGAVERVFEKIISTIVAITREFANCHNVENIDNFVIVF